MNNPYGHYRRHNTPTRDDSIPGTSRARAILWKYCARVETKRAEKAERMAALWKEVAREHFRRTHAARGYIEALQGGIDMERARAEKAEENVRAREEMINRLSDRAEKAEHVAKERAATIEERAALIEQLRAEQPRALTSDAITDEMVQRGMDKFCELDVTGTEPLMHVIEQTLRAALTEPPSRPEWEDAPYVWADSAQGGGRVIWKRSTSDDGRVIWSSGGTWHPSWMLTNPAPVVPEGVRVVTEEEARHATDE